MRRPRKNACHGHDQYNLNSDAELLEFVFVFAQIDLKYDLFADV